MKRAGWLWIGCLLLFISGCSRLPLDRSDILRAGPMLGYATQREVAIWLQTSKPASVQVKYWPEAQPGFARTSPRLRTGAENDNIALIALSELKMDQRYQYEVRLDGVPIDRPYPLYFKTRRLWEWREDPPEFSVVVGSCAYINETEFDRPGEPYGGQYQIFGNILRTRPDFMLWLGDNVYLREVDWGSAAGIAHRYAHTRQTEEMQALLANVNNYAIWDDHDYGPDNSDRSFPLKALTTAAFERYWANPSYGLPELPGTFTSFSWGDADFFLLDDRTYRSPSHSPETPEKQLLGPEQLDWLIDALDSSLATFKFVANGSQVLNPFALHETYARFPHERAKLLQAIHVRRIEGVIFLSGDRHFTELTRLDRPEAYPLHDLTSSPLTAGLSAPSGDEVKNPLRVEGTLLLERNFVRMSFTGPGDDRILTLTAFDSDGQQRWQRQIKAQDLAYP